MTESDRVLLEKLDMEHRAKLTKQANVEKKIQEEQLKEKSINVAQTVSQDDKAHSKTCEEKNVTISSRPNPKSKLKVTYIILNFRINISLSKYH